MRSFSFKAIYLTLLGFTPVSSYQGAWLVHADGKYLALDGTLSITDPSQPSIAQCQVIAYANNHYAWGLECGPEPVAGQPYDPPYVGIDPADDRARIVATVRDGGPDVQMARLGNWSLTDLPGAKREDDPTPLFRLNWWVPGKEDAGFWVDGDGFLWAVFGEGEVSGARSVDLTAYRND